MRKEPRLRMAHQDPALQLHGFADRSSPGHDVLLSPGPIGPTPAARSATRALSSAGFTVCSARSQGCGRLESTTNVQARTAAAQGVDFLHVENSRTIRDDPAARARLVDVLADIARGWS